MLFADLGGFKAVNDTCGHAAGDQVLQEVARRLQVLQRPGDSACGLSGDEFLVLCEESGLAQAEGVAKRLQAALASLCRIVLQDAATRNVPPGSVRVTVSIGIAATTDPATSCPRLLHEADTAMYRTKRV